MLAIIELFLARIEASPNPGFPGKREAQAHQRGDDGEKERNSNDLHDFIARNRIGGLLGLFAWICFLDKFVMQRWPFIHGTIHHGCFIGVKNLSAVTFDQSKKAKVSPFLIPNTPFYDLLPMSLHMYMGKSYRKRSELCSPVPQLYDGHQTDNRKSISL